MINPEAGARGYGEVPWSQGVRVDRLPSPAEPHYTDGLAGGSVQSVLDPRHAESVQGPTHATPAPDVPEQRHGGGSIDTPSSPVALSRGSVPQRRTSGGERLTGEAAQAGGVSAVPRGRAVPDLTDTAGDDAVELYFREIDTVPLLTAKEEVSLARQIERSLDAQRQLAGDSTPHSQDRQAELEQLVADGNNAREHLTRANLRLVVSIAKKYMDRGVPFLDLI